MSFIGDEFSPAKGAGFQAQSANVADALGGGQLEQSYANTQSGLNQQQQFINALQGQNGIGNQSSVFAQQQALANQLGAQSRGEGPNPANAQLAQATGRNVEQQAALMGSQRGASANAGLMARQASMRGGDIQQQAAGQAATMNAQQQLAAQSALQQQQSMMGGMATQQVGQQAGAISNYNQFAQNQNSAYLNALAQRNAANVGMQQNINTTMGGIAGINAQGQWQTTGGLMKGLSSAASMMGGGGGGGGAAGAAPAAMAHGGMVHKYAIGGEVPPQSFVATINGPSLASANVSGGAGFSSPTFDSGMTNAIGDAAKSLAKKQPINKTPPGPTQGQNGNKNESVNAFGDPTDWRGAAANTSLADYTPGTGHSDVSGAEGPTVQEPVNMSMNNSPMMARGGQVRRYAEGGEAEAAPPQQQAQPDVQQQQAAPLQESQPVQSQSSTQIESSKPESFAASALSSGNVAADVSGGASFSSPSFDSGMKDAFTPPSSGGGGGGGGGGGSSSMMSMLPMLAMAASRGGPVPGKAQVHGDSLKNDKVKAMLSPGEIVIPRSITQGPNAVDKSAQFVQAILAKNGRGKKNG